MAADFNADGILDLVTFDGSVGILSYWQGVGDGTFVQLSNLSPLDFESSSLNSLITGDFDGDGVPDVGGLTTDFGQETTPNAFTAFLHFNANAPAFSFDFPTAAINPAHHDECSLRAASFVEYR